MRTRGALLVVNADDYGYFSCVSRGILDAARRGRVTATGVLANAPRFVEHAEALRSAPDLDVGVHLTLTFGRPLTERMAEALAPWGRCFPRSKARLALSVLGGRIPLAAVQEEWEAQLGRCRDEGLAVRFLNTHEHVHLLPSLDRVVRRLAAADGIRYVRQPAPEWSPLGGAAGLARNAAFQVARWLAPPGREPGAPRLIGVSESGRLTLAYLARRLETLVAGRVYELMCHPGHLDPREIQDPRLLSYHRWEQEQALLTGEAFGALCAERGVRLVRYRDLDATEEGEKCS